MTQSDNIPRHLCIRSTVNQVVTGRTGPCPEGKVIRLHAHARVAGKSVVSEYRCLWIAITARQSDHALLALGQLTKVHNNSTRNVLLPPVLSQPGSAQAMQCAILTGASGLPCSLGRLA